LKIMDIEAFAEGFVLAGGRSTRMGRDKVLLRVAGRSLLEFALEKLRTLPLASAPRIVGGQAQVSAYAPLVPDLHPGCGPLSGIEAALAASSQRLNVLVPVDTPLLPPQFLLWMLRRAQITGAVATIPRINGQPQPLCAVYDRRLLGNIQSALEAGNWKVMPAVRAEDPETPPGEWTDIFDVEAVASTDSWLLDGSRVPPYRWFHNCNTPADIAWLENALVLTQ
jgi:molybdenum cofactor guanylyltransferase